MCFDINVTLSMVKVKGRVKVNFWRAAVDIRARLCRVQPTATAPLPVYGADNNGADNNADAYCLFLKVPISLAYSKKGCTPV